MKQIDRQPTSVPCPDCGCRADGHNAVNLPMGVAEGQIVNGVPAAKVAHCGMCGSCWTTANDPYFVSIVEGILRSKALDWWGAKTLDAPGVAGIYVGGCVERGPGSSFRKLAHAHNDTDFIAYGWICVRSWRRLYVDRKPGEPSRLLMHEKAHIDTPRHGHDDAWRARMRALRQPIPARYKKGGRRRVAATIDD